MSDETRTWVKLTIVVEPFDDSAPTTVTVECAYNVHDHLDYTHLGQATHGSIEWDMMPDEDGNLITVTSDSAVAEAAG